MGMLNGYLNEQIEAKKAKGLFAIASAIEKLSIAISNKTVITVVIQNPPTPESEASNG